MTRRVEVLVFLLTLSLSAGFCGVGVAWGLGSSLALKDQGSERWTECVLMLFASDWWYGPACRDRALGHFRRPLGCGEKVR